MACNQKQINDFPWTVKRAAALFREARTDFTEKGITDFNEIVDGLSARHNLKREIIVKGLSSPRGVSRTLTDDMWVKQQAARRVANTAKATVREWDQNKFKKGLNWLADAPRRVVLTGHFAAFTKSHLSDQLAQNPAVYARNFVDSWHLATEHGRALHEQRLMSEFDPTDADYKLALRAGLNVGEGGLGKFQKETTELTGIKKIFSSKNLPDWLTADRASMAYDELRISRMQIFRQELTKLSPEEKGDIDEVKALASVINHDTGTVTVSKRIMRFLFLSPRLLPAQLAHTFYDIPRALYNTGLGFNYAESAPAMRYVARKTAILASAYTASMAANIGIGMGVYKATGDRKLADQFTPNIGQKGINRADWLRIKAFGYSIPISPTIELLKLPFQMVAAGAAARPGESKVMAAGMRGLRTLLTRQNPLGALVEEALFGQDVQSARPLPFPGITGPTKPTKTKKAMTWSEYGGQKLPIPLANYVQEFTDEATSKGMHPQTAMEWAKMLAAPTIEVATSYHLSPQYPSKPQPPNALSRALREHVPAFPQYP